MDVQAKLNEERDQYELGAAIDGVFVPFVTVPKAQADGHVESVKASQGDQRGAGEQPWGGQH